MPSSCSSVIMPSLVVVPPPPSLLVGPGEPLRPLSSTASGGESARIMLALKAAPIEAAAAAAGAAGPRSEPGPAEEEEEEGGRLPGAPIMILDELDSGIGARLGAAVGRILRTMSEGVDGVDGPAGQIICVTHLPQVVHQTPFWRNFQLSKT